MSLVLNSGKNFKGLFFSETTMLISIEFHMQSSDSGNKGTKVYSNGPGHLTKMATMTIYGKNR